MICALAETDENGFSKRDDIAAFEEAGHKSTGYDVGAAERLPNSDRFGGSYRTLHAAEDHVLVEDYRSVARVELERRLLLKRQRNDGDSRSSQVVAAGRVLAKQ